MHSDQLSGLRHRGHKAGICTLLQNLETSTELIDDLHNQTKTIPCNLSQPCYLLSNPPPLSIVKSSSRDSLDCPHV